MSAPRKQTEERRKKEQPGKAQQSQPPPPVSGGPKRVSIPPDQEVEIEAELAANASRAEELSTAAEEEPQPKPGEEKRRGDGATQMKEDERRLPRIAAKDEQQTQQQTEPKSPSKRDVSHLKDARGRHRKPGTIPPTQIPEQYHIKEDVVAPQSGSKEAVFDEKERVWKTTVFPSMQPTSRQEVLLLEQWLNNMLLENQAKNLGPIEAVKEAQKLYAICFNEILRQVYVTCTERGQLLEKIWARYLQLFDHILKIRERERSQYNQKLQQQMMMYQQLYQDKDQAFNKVYLNLAAEKEKLQMAKDKLERAVLLLHEDFKRRVRKEKRMKKVIDHLRLKAHDESEGVATEEGGYVSEEAMLPPDISDDCFSANNLLVVQRLQFIEDKLRSMKLGIPQEQMDSNYGAMLELESLLSTLSDTISSLSETPAVDSLTAEARRQGLVEGADHGHVQVEKSAQANPDEVSCSSVPQSILHLWSHSFKMPRETVHEKSWAVAHINAIYALRILADEEADAKNRRRATFPEFVYDVFISLYGVRQLAEARMADFFATLMSLSSAGTPRVIAFMKFCDESFNLEDLGFFLFVLSMFYEPNSDAELTLHDGADGAQWITMECARLVVDSTFRDQEPDFIASLIAACETASLQGKVDLDMFLQAMVEKCHSLGAGPEEQLSVLYTTTFGATSPAWLTFGDFSALMHSFAGMEMPDRKLNKMYRETLDEFDAAQRDRHRPHHNAAQQQGKSFLPSIITVARKHRLLSWKAFPPTRVDQKRINELVFMLLSLLWCSASVDVQRQLVALQANSESTDAAQARQFISDQHDEVVRQIEASDNPRALVLAFRKFNEQVFLARPLEASSDGTVPISQ